MNLAKSLVRTKWEKVWEPTVMEPSEVAHSPHRRPALVSFSENFKLKKNIFKIQIP